jgi:plasmid stabilization system protein ParE
MRYAVVFTPEAEEQIAELYHYIAQAASPDVAQHYTEAIITYCEGLHTFPHRSTPRDDIRPGLRVTNYKGRCAIAFAVASETVSIIGVFYGGQDYEALLLLKDED